jgi:CheY-like chemotaxis protein
MPDSLVPLLATRTAPPRLAAGALARLTWTASSLADSLPPPVPGSALPGGVPGRSASGDEIRVLLVDDNRATLARVSTALAPGCVIVGAVTDGEAALAAARELSPDVIVLDISMPGLSGFELATRLRQLGSGAALVFLSVHDEQEFILAARDVGALGYVEKPRLAIDLLHAVREARAGRSFFSR